MPAPPFLAPSTKPQTYIGICRCKANKFTVTLPSLTEGFKCNCSICSMADHLVATPDKGALKVEREGPLITYQFNTGKAALYMCATCGNLVKGQVDSDPLAINLRLLQDVDIWSLKANPKFDGAALPPPYKPPEFTGPHFPDDKGEGTKVYYGSCHCGACTIALRSKPLPNVLVNECNCAYCWKDARIHVYPSSDNVHLSGVENLKPYMSNPAGGGFFCKTCGISLLDADLDGAHDGDGNRIPNAKEALGHDLRICAVNIRVLRDVEWDKLRINKYDGRSKDPQFVAD